MKKDYITNSELCDLLIDNSIEKAIEKLGLKRTLKSIESLKQPIYRAKLRQGYYRYIDKIKKGL